MSDSNEPREKKSHGCLKALAVVAAIIVVAIVALVMALSKKDRVESFTWPESELVAQIPTPSWADVDEDTGAATLEGELESESETYFWCYVAASSNNYEEYVAACEEAGFTVDYYRGGTSYSAENEAGYSLSLRYYDEDDSSYEVAVMSISLYAPDEEDDGTEEAETSDASSTADEGAASDSSTTESSDSSEVDPDLKAWLDAYEAFMDSYVDFMLEYEDADDDEALDMLADYTEMMAEYAELAAELDEWDTDEMSAADLAYYLEVTARIEERLAELYE